MQLEKVFEENQRFIWGLSYRMTGSAADADDICQEAFVRLMQTPPADIDSPLRPWLARVAVNLSRDLLRRRRRQKYVGQWLPSPFETENNDLEMPVESITGWNSEELGSPSVRYELLESVSFAFLLALEVLTPTQRAVLLLRDVFDLNVAETASILQMSEQNVKTTHHRARKQMQTYEKDRFVPRRSLVKETASIVRQLTRFLTERDTDSAARLLATNVVCLSDGGGEYFAAKVPVTGRQKVAVFLQNLLKMTAGTKSTVVEGEMNGAFSLTSYRIDAPDGYAPRVVTVFETDRFGLINRVYFSMAPSKLSALRPKFE